MNEARKPLDWQSLDNASAEEVEVSFQTIEQLMKDAVSRAIAETAVLRSPTGAGARRAS